MGEIFRPSNRDEVVIFTIVAISFFGDTQSDPYPNSVHLCGEDDDQPWNFHTADPDAQNIMLRVTSSPNILDCTHHFEQFTKESPANIQGGQLLKKVSQNVYECESDTPMCVGHLKFRRLLMNGRLTAMFDNQTNRCPWCRFFAFFAQDELLQGNSRRCSTEHPVPMVQSTEDAGQSPHRRCRSWQHEIGISFLMCAGWP